MNLRRIAFLSIRLLAVYFFVRGIESVVNLVALEAQRSFDWSAWPAYVAAAVPVIVAPIIWMWSKRIAINLAEAEIFSDDEILDDRAEGLLDGTRNADEAIGAPDRVGNHDAFLRIGIVLLAINMIVFAGRLVLEYALSLALWPRTDQLCSHTAPFPAPVSPCSGFWTPQNTNAVVYLIGYAFVLLVGITMIRRSRRLSEFLISYEPRKKHELIDDEPIA